MPIAEGLAKGDTSEEQLRKWEPEFTEGMEPHEATGLRLL